MHPEQVEISSDAKTVWVHALDGSTVGRFSTVFGMDVHTTVTEQMQGASQCLHCTHVKPDQADWVNFCELMNTHYGILVDQALIQI